MGGTKEALERIPTVGVSLTANIGGDRQIVLQGHYDRDNPAEGDTLLAQMNGRIDALMAPHKIREIEKELGQIREALANQRKNIAVLDDNAAREQAARVITLDEMQLSLERADKEARAAWVNRGKEGDYRESNKVTQIRDRLEAERASAAKAQAEHESQKALAEEQCKLNIARFEREIAEREGDIAKLRALLPDGG